MSDYMWQRRKNQQENWIQFSFSHTHGGVGGDVVDLAGAGPQVSDVSLCVVVVVVGKVSVRKRAKGGKGGGAAAQRGAPSSGGRARGWQWPGGSAQQG